MTREGENHAHAVKAALLLLLLLALAIIVWRKAPPVLFDPGWIEDFLEDLGWLAPVAFVLLRVVAIVVTVVPNAPLDIAGGMMFGPFWGTVYSLLGSELGAIACFLLSQHLGREAISRLLHRDISFRSPIASRHLALAVLVARLEPVFSFALVSYGAGLTGISFRAFAIATLIGMTPGTVILNYYGRSFFTGGLMMQICLGLSMVLLLLIIPVWIKQKGQQGESDE